MSIRIDKITCGRFGNKIFQYNNLVQLANNIGIEPSCVTWEGNQYFKNIVNYIPSKNKKKKIIYWNEILEKNNEEIKELLKNNDLQLDDPSYALHNTFCKLTKKNPRHFLEFKDELKPKLDNDCLYIGIHIRGGDILGGDKQDGREIHTPDYYKKAIEHVIKNSSNEKKKYLFIICTDDVTFPSTIETINYLKEKNYNYSLGPNFGSSQYINDFSALCYCDILINSSSTFCCSTVFIGKENKIVYHSKDWMDRIVRGDFSNQEYKKYVKIWTHTMNDYEWRHVRGYEKAKIFWIDIEKNDVNYYNNIIII